MNREDIRKLLGGYATGTLTPEEEQALFAAALEDQELFDALGREQALRDLLRDPAAKAHLLATLDTPRGGFWNWLRRPMVAGLSVAAVAAIAVVAVWQASQRPPARVLVAELKMEQPKEIAPAPAAAPVRESPPPEEKRPAPRKLKTEAASLRDTMKDAAAVNLPAAASAPAPPPPPAVAAPPGASTQTVEVTAATAVLQAPQAKALEQVAQDKLTMDARSLFYGNSFAPRANAVMPSATAGSGGAQPTFRVAGTLAKKETASLGVRVSVLRGAEEVAATTILNAGESVRLRLTPNEDGFLYVAAREDGTWKMLASGPAQRLTPFETPPLAFAGAGEKQVYLLLSRQPLTLAPQALAGFPRANLVESTAELDHATYVVSRVQAEQVVQPITLTYR